MQVQLGWPLKASPAFTDFHYYAILNYVDQNPEAVAYSDYNCGARSYDGHSGTDIMLYPFSWNMMADEAVDVVAAAPGEIILLHDGEPDKNCAMSDAPSNRVVISHEDGSQTWYSHFKQGSISKVQGDSVLAGEKIGTIGSSGSSTEPHLHFEVHDPQDNIIDPFFAGPECNKFNGSSWWAQQIPYRERRVQKIMMSDALIEESLECGVGAITHERHSFCPGQKALFYRFYMDILWEDSAKWRVYAPGGTEFSKGSDIVADIVVQNKWAQAPVYTALRLRSEVSLPPDAALGTWSVEIQYADLAYERTFEVSLENCPCQSDADCALSDVCDEQSHTCTLATGGETDGSSSDTMGPMTSGTTSTVTTDSGTTSTATADGPPTGGEATSAMTSAEPQPVDSLDGQADSATTVGLVDHGGCGCATPGGHNGAAGSLVLLLAIGRRRRAW